MSDESQHDDTAAAAHCCYAAVVENRAKEVGMAVLNISSLTLHITQFIEAGRSYSTAQMLLDTCQPQHLVIVGSQHPEVAGAAGINQVTAATWEQRPLPRSAFDDTKGILAVQELTTWGRGSTPETAATVDKLHKSHYLGFGAAGALLTHVGRNLGLVLAPKAVQVEFDGIKHHMAIDRDAVMCLEILPATKTKIALQRQLCRAHNQAATPPFVPDPAVATTNDGAAPAGRQGSRRGKASHTAHWSAATSRCSSLFGFLNHTSTTCGARLLRTNLLQPLTDINTLQLRLDSLQELLESPHMTLELAPLMDMLPKNLDHVCSNLAVRPGATSIKDPSVRLGRLVSAVILLRDLLRCLPVIADSMAWVDSTLLKAIRHNLGQQKLQKLLADIEAVLDDDAQASKTQFVNKVQQCFAVRTKVDSFLDVSRATFTRVTESIHHLAAQYRSTTGITTLKMQYSTSKGFYIVVPESSAPQGQTGSLQLGRGAGRQEPSVQLPRSFLVLEKRGRQCTCVTTHELNALNSRLRDSAADCMILTVQVMEKLVDQLLLQMPVLQQVLDNLALLDVLLSFFQATAGGEGDWCRPMLFESGPLAITEGRHPLLQAIKDPHISCQPNDAYISSSCTLHLIMGPNMSGKSTYLKQVALLVVMAQIGCYVPASFMSLTPYVSLHTRIGTQDSIEANASSFMVEMTDMAHLLSRASSRSLVLIDELGRATSTADGVGLCWAFAEYLLALGSHVVLATHFQQLQELADLYPACKLWRMQVGISNGDMKYQWKIADAALAAAASDKAAAHYGILLARMAGLPSSITNRAMQLAVQLDQRQQQQQQRQQEGGNRRRRWQVYSLVHKLACVARKAAAEGTLGSAAGTAGDAIAAGTAVQQCLVALKQDSEQLLLMANT